MENKQRHTAETKSISKKTWTLAVLARILLNALRITALMVFAKLEEVLSRAQHMLIVMQSFTVI